MDVEEEENKNIEVENETIDFDSLSKHDLERLLVASAKDGVLERAKLLLDKGASPDAKEYNRSLFYASENYTTPLQNAASGGFHELTQYLIEHEGILFCFCGILAPLSHHIQIPISSSLVSCIQEDWASVRCSG